MQRTDIPTRFSLVLALFSMLAGCAAPSGGETSDVGIARSADTTPPPGYTFCAAEYQFCAFSGTRTVAYGANGVYAYRTATDGIQCDNSNFGDPLRGVDKSCYVR